MRKIVLSVVLVLSAWMAVAQNAAQVKIAEMDKGVYSTAHFGVYAMYADGTPIAQLNPVRKFNPASNMKVVTTGMALLTLGPDYRWYTEIAHSGTIDETGVLHGNLYIIGGGDPTLCTGTLDASPAVLQDSLFASWKGILDRAGIKSIEGAVIGDGSWLEGMRQEPSWNYDDLGTFYATCISGLNLYENRLAFRVTPGKNPGEALSIAQTFPDTPWMQWRCEGKTGEKGSGDKLFLYSNENSTTGIFRGTFAPDRGLKTVQCRNNYPEYSLAYGFASYLNGVGMPVQKGALQLGYQGPYELGDAQHVIPSRQGGLKVIERIPSKSLLEVIDRTNKESDNFYAEILFRTLGKTLGGSTDIAPSRSAVLDALRLQCGLTPSRSQLIVTDGSGLSCHNFVTPRWMCTYLAAMFRTKYYESFRGSLLKHSPRIYMKTGSFTSCRTLCGYILPSDGDASKTIIFSIMVNNSERTIWQIDRDEKALLDILATLN